MILLSIEASTDTAVVGLLSAGQVRERRSEGARRHAEQLLDMIAALLDEAGIGRDRIDALAVGQGPGGFTGVRLALASVQGLALALDRPVIALSSLAILAQEAFMAGQGGAFAVAQDARMGEIYQGGFVAGPDGLVRACMDECLSAPEHAVWPERDDWVCIGSGWSAYDPRLMPPAQARAGAALIQPSARAQLALAAEAMAAGRILSADALQPSYLRDKVALTLAEQGRTG